MTTSLPTPGTEMEIFGVRATFLTADIGPTGTVVITARVTQGNMSLILKRAADSGSDASMLTQTIIQVQPAACVAKHHGNSLSNEGYLQASKAQSLVQLQRVLARRMRFSA